MKSLRKRRGETMTIENTLMASEIESGQMKVHHLHGVAVAIANVEGAFYAVSDVCPHDGGSLSWTARL
jgi:nitrite reductase/ring-hydroxylating ferredoxin subunit